MLKKGGVLLNFDANWYAYLFDEDAQAAWDRDRRSSAERGVWDQNVEAEGEHFDVMEEIARRVPLSKSARPAWDLQQLASLGLKAEADETVWKRVWSEEETISFASIPDVSGAGTEIAALFFRVRDKSEPKQQDLFLRRALDTRARQ